MTRSDLERSFRCRPLDCQWEGRETDILNAYVDIEKHFRSVGTVEIFDFPTRPSPRVLDASATPQMARVGTQTDG